MEANTENKIDFYTNSHYITVSFKAKKWVNKIERLYESNPNEFKYYQKNEDGSVRAKIPSKWLKLNSSEKNKKGEKDEI